MPNIKPISDLRNYTKVLSEVREGSPVYLTKNGRGTHAIIDIKDLEEYEAARSFAYILQELEKADDSIKKGNVVTDSEIREYFEGKHKDDQDY